MDLGKIDKTVPVALFAGTNDDIATVADAKILKDRVPGVMKLTILEGFSHFEFNFNSDGKFYDDLFATVRQFNPKAEMVQEGAEDLKDQEVEEKIIVRGDKGNSNKDTNTDDNLVVVKETDPKIPVTDFWSAIERDVWLWASSLFGFSIVFNDIPFFTNLLSTTL